MVQNNLQLKTALDEFLLQRLNSMPSEQELASRQIFSPKFERKMRRLIRKASKLEEAAYRPEPAVPSVLAVPADLDDRSGRSRHKVALTWKRLVLVAVILSILISVFGISSAREAVFSFFIRVYKSFSTIIFTNESGSPSASSGAVPSAGATSKTTDITAAAENAAGMEPTMLPEGYVLNERFEAEGLIQLFYMNQAGDELIFERQVSANLQVIIDTEDTRAEDIMVGPSKGIYFSNKGIQNLIWQEGRHAFTISGKVAKEDLLNMADSLNR